MSENCNSVIRVLHMIGSLEVGGSQSMVMNLYRNIDKNKIQFDFIVEREENSFYKNEIFRMGGKIYRLPKFNGKNLIKIIAAWDDFLSKHSEYKILHSHVRSYASIFLPIAKRHGLKTIIHSHSTSNGKGFSALVKKIMQYPLRYQADYLFACSKEAGEWLFGKNAVKKCNFKIIRNGINCDRFRFSEENRELIRKEYGIENNFVIGHIGRHCSAKNYIFLIEICAEIYKRDKNARLLQVGKGEITDQIQDKCRELGIKDSVIFAGAHLDTEKYYSAMDVFLFPSLYEGLGMVAVEAQTNGLNVIASDAVPALADIGAGIFHYVSLNQSAEEWADIILKYTNTERCEKTVEISKKGGWDVNDTAVKLEKMYCDIIEEQA